MASMIDRSRRGVDRDEQLGASIWPLRLAPPSGAPPPSGQADKGSRVAVSGDTHAGVWAMENRYVVERWRGSGPAQVATWLPSNRLLVFPPVLRTTITTAVRIGTNGRRNPQS